MPPAIEQRCSRLHSRAAGQRGEGRIGFILTLLVVLTAAWVGYKWIPVRINAYQFRDTLREEATYASVNRTTDSEIRGRILDQARALAIPIDPDDVSIERSRKEIAISARYVQEVDLKFTTFTYRFSDIQRAPIF